MTAHENVEQAGPSEQAADVFRPWAYYQDATGFLWRWRPTVWHDQTEHCDWFPQAYTGPGPVPAPVQPVHLVYDEHGYSVLTYVAPTDGGMYGAPQPDENGEGHAHG